MWTPLRTNKRYAAIARSLGFVIVALGFVGSVSAADLDPADLDPSEQPNELRFFDSPVGDVREGYFTLHWNEIAGATSYQVTDSDGKTVYDGVSAKSFHSGLTDGTYSFSVRAIGAGGVLASTSDPAVVTVRHWKLRDALMLFAVGLLVVVAIAVVIVRGALLSSASYVAGKRDSIDHPVASQGGC